MYDTSYWFTSLSRLTAIINNLNQTILSNYLQKMENLTAKLKHQEEIYERLRERRKLEAFLFFDRPEKGFLYTVKTADLAKKQKVYETYKYYLGMHPKDTTFHIAQSHVDTYVDHSY